MKKIALLILLIVCMYTSTVFADTNCQTPCKKQQECKQKVYTRTCPADTFLCTNKDKDELFKCVGLSDTQICTAEKINDKYEMEVLSLNEKIKCEQKKLYDLKKACCKGSDYRATKREIKSLKRERKKICKCYEEQFKAILSDEQKKQYRKTVKN